MLGQSILNGTGTPRRVICVTLSLCQSLRITKALIVGGASRGSQLTVVVGLRCGPRRQYGFHRKASPLCARLIETSTILSITRLGVFHFMASLF